MFVDSNISFLFTVFQDIGSRLSYSIIPNHSVLNCIIIAGVCDPNWLQYETVSHVGEDELCCVCESCGFLAFHHPVVRQGVLPLSRSLGLLVCSLFGQINLRNGD